MRAFITKHAPLLLFHGVILILLIGLTWNTGTKHYDKIGLVVLSLDAFYFLFYKFHLFQNLIRYKIARFFEFKSEKLNIVLFSVTITLFLIDVITLKGLPA